MRSSPKHSLLSSGLQLQTTRTEMVDAADVDQCRSPHAIDNKDPNYDPFDDEDEYIDFYLEEEAVHLGTVPYQVVRSTKTHSTPGKRNPNPRLSVLSDQAMSNNRFHMSSSASHVVVSLAEFKAAADGILDELFDSNDFATCVTRINEIHCRLYHDEFIAYAVRLSLDRTDSERDKVAELITLMRKSGHLSIGQISRAFEKIFLNWEDICLDVPTAPGMILKFVELGIADGVIPHGFIAKLPEQFLSTVAAIEPCVEEFPEIVHQLVSLKNFKKHSAVIVDEFIRDQGALTVAEVAGELRKLKCSDLHHEFVRRAINKSLDKSDGARELVCQLLSGLRDSTLSEDDFLWGFSHLLGGLNDLVLDCPNAVELVSKFLVRAVTDEIIPPSFLENAIRLGLGDENGVMAATAAKLIIDNAQVEWAELRHVWNESDALSSSTIGDKWRTDLDDAITEYIDSHDKVEFCQLMHEWGLFTSQAVTLVKEALLKAMDRSGGECIAVVELLEYAVRTAEELRPTDIARALAELDAAQDDLKLDIPDFVPMLNTFGGLLRAKDLIPLVSSPRASAN